MIFDLLVSRNPPYGGLRFQNASLFDCTLHTNSPGGITDVVARHVSFAQITF